MAARLHLKHLSLAVFALGFALACDDNESKGSSSDGGAEAGVTNGNADDSTNPDTNPSSTPGPDVNTSDDTSDDTATPEPSTEGPECAMPVVVSCDGKDRVQHDPCTNKDKVLETCDGSCESGECVVCTPTGGVICSGGDKHQLDSCQNVGDVIEDCANGCSKGNCIAEDCKPNADKECVGSLLFSVDSCGNQTNVEDVCENGCADGACVGCVDVGQTLCFAGGVYPVNSCGQTGDLIEQCQTSCTVTSGGDSTTAMCSDTQCTPTENTECFRGDLYAVDSCGGILEQLVTDCHNGCDENGCLACVPSPDGSICFDGDVYDTVGGCGDPSVRADAPSEQCQFGCFNGACATEGQCVPQGTICSAGDLHAYDSCQQVGDVVEDCVLGCENGACISGPDSGVPDAGGPTTGPTAVDSGTSETSTTTVIDSGMTSTGTSTTDTLDAGPDAGDAAP